MYVYEGRSSKNILYCARMYRIFYSKLNKNDIFSVSRQRNDIIPQTKESKSPFATYFYIISSMTLKEDASAVFLKLFRVYYIPLLVAIHVPWKK